MKRLCSLLLIVAVVPVLSRIGMTDDDAKEEQVTLLPMVLEWRYPEAQFVDGAEMADAGIEGIFAVKCKSILSTPDSVDKVMEFYRKKLNVDEKGSNLGEKKGERLKTNRAVTIQNVSGGDASKVFLIAINETKLSTTLVISRSDRDDVTRIAWSNFRQIAVNRP